MISTLVLTSLLTFSPVPWDFALAVAETLQGEGAQVVEAMVGDEQVYVDAVCTVRNRLESDEFDTSNVLAPYYAPRRSTSRQHVQRAFDILNHNVSVDCGSLWYMYSHQDVIKLNIPLSQIARRYTSPTLEWFGLNYVNKQRGR